MSAPHYWLAAHVVACTTPRGAVLLDLQRNRYLGINAEQAAALPHVIANWATPSSSPQHGPTPRALDALRASGLVVEDPAQALRPFVLAEITVAHVHAAHCSSRLAFSHLRAFACACLWARLALRRQPLLRIATTLSHLKHNASERTDAARHDDAKELQHTFRRLRPLAFMAHDRCLFHALALSRFLAYFQVHATWVIGVRTQPWAAHSWVQLGNELLDATPEQVCEFTPILAI